MPQPALLRHPQHHGPRLIEQEHGAVGELIAAVKRDGNVGALVGLAAKAAAQGVVAIDDEELDPILVLEMMQPVGDGRFARGPQDLGHGDHL